MPEYLHPGVYVEETSFRARSIEGVPTDVAGFVGPTLKGPMGLAQEDGEPLVLTSLTAFQRHYGGLGDIQVGRTLETNHVARAARAYFANGGRRLHVVRLPARRRAADYAAGLSALLSRKDVALVAAPGAGPAVHPQLIAHAASPGAFRLALLDPPAGLSVSGAKALADGYESSHAALFYPRIRHADGGLDPPSGAVAGIYARVDAMRGVWKSPANEAIAGAAGLERALGAAEQEVLNPAGVNCIRSFPGRGIRLYGARTLAADGEWKYVSVRRTITYFEHSIDEGTQWVAFEPNDEPLWARVRQSVGDFLYRQWMDGALLGRTADQAYFVRCDRTTMTQADIDAGRLVCLIGVAMLRPAEFVTILIRKRTG